MAHLAERWRMPWLFTAPGWVARIGDPAPRHATKGAPVNA